MYNLQLSILEEKLLYYPMPVSLLGPMVSMSVGYFVGLSVIISGIFTSMLPSGHVFYYQKIYNVHIYKTIGLLFSLFLPKVAKMTNRKESLPKQKKLHMLKDRILTGKRSEGRGQL